MNKMIVRTFIMIMFAYSARKKRAKGPPAYSTLNPDTNSDSPSVRSKGARLVSASVEINHIMAKGQEGISNQIYSWVVIIVGRVKEPFIKRRDKIIMASVTSYEIVCATARRAPISAYFEFEAQPDHIMVYTARLDRARINNRLRFILARGYGMGSGVHIVRAKVRAMVGAIINNRGDDASGCSGSLVNSLIASAIGWSNP